MSEVYSIKRLILDFPNGETPRVCSDIARHAQSLTRSRISSGGMQMTYMPLTKEEENERGCEFSEDVMQYEFGYTKESPWTK